MLTANLLAQNRDINLGGIDAPTTAYQPGIGSDVTRAGTQLELFLSNILALITIFAGLSFLLFFVFGTMQWILAGGDEGKVANARKQMTNGALGLILTLIAYGIMGVISQVLGLDFLDIGAAITTIAPI